MLLLIDTFPRPVRPGKAYDDFGHVWWLRLYFLWFGVSFSNMTLPEFCDAARLGIIRYRSK